MSYDGNGSLSSLPLPEWMSALAQPSTSEVPKLKRRGPPPKQKQDGKDGGKGGPSKTNVPREVLVPHSPWLTGNDSRRGLPNKRQRQEETVTEGAKRGRPSKDKGTKPNKKGASTRSKAKVSKVRLSLLLALVEGTCRLIV